MVKIYEKFVVGESQRIAILFAEGRDETALIRCTRLLDLIDLQHDSQQLRSVVFATVPAAFYGSKNCERRLLPRWSVRFRGESVVVRAKNKKEAQWEAAQVLVSLDDLEAVAIVDADQDVPYHV